MKHGCTLPFIVAHSVPAPWRIFEKHQESELQEFIRRLFKVDGVSEELQKKQGEKNHFIGWNKQKSTLTIIH